MIRSTSHPIPVLETARLRLRGHTPADLTVCAELWGNAEVTRFIGGKPSTAEETWSRLLRYLGHWTLLGFGYWLVEERETKDFVGEVGLSDYKRELHPAFGATPEAGWVLHPRHHGKGYATEALRAVLEWERTALGSKEIGCIIAPENSASFRVAERCGFVESLRTVYKGSPTVILRRRAASVSAGASDRDRARVSVL